MGCKSRGSSFARPWRCSTRIAAPPAWDRAFGTIDFLTLLDLKLLSSAARHRFLAPLTQ